MKATIQTTTLVKWKPIQDFPGYFISNNGLVRINSSLLNQRQLSREVCPYKYVHLNNHDTNQSHKKDVHRLVWEYFGDKPKGKGFDVHHIDLDCTNNHISNLCLLTKKEHKRLHSNVNRKSKDDLPF